MERERIYGFISAGSSRMIVIQGNDGRPYTSRDFAHVGNPNVDIQRKLVSFERGDPGRAVNVKFVSREEALEHFPAETLESPA